MSVHRLEVETIQKIASTVAMLADATIQKMVLEHECMKYLKEYNVNNYSDRVLFEKAICNLFHYANIGNALAYAIQYNETPDCFPLKFETKDSADYPGPTGIEAAIADGSIYSTLNEAQDECRHLRYNLYTNGGNSFMPSGYENLFNALTDYLVKAYPHIMTEEEIATDEAYRKAYSD